MIIDTSNAPCGPGFLPGLRLSERRFSINRRLPAVSAAGAVAGGGLPTLSGGGPQSRLRPPCSSADRRLPPSPISGVVGERERDTERERDARSTQRVAPRTGSTAPCSPRALATPSPVTASIPVAAIGVGHLPRRARTSGRGCRWTLARLRADRATRAPKGPRRRGGKLQRFGTQRVPAVLWGSPAVPGARAALAACPASSSSLSPFAALRT